MLPLPEKVHVDLEKLFVRALGIQEGLKDRLGDSKGMQTFLEAALRRCGATHRFDPPNHQKAGRQRDKDWETLQTKARELLSQGYESTSAAHHYDAWALTEGKAGGRARTLTQQAR